MSHLRACFDYELPWLPLAIADSYQSSPDAAGVWYNQVAINYTMNFSYCSHTVTLVSLCVLLSARETKTKKKKKKKKENKKKKKKKSQSECK